MKKEIRQLWIQGYFLYKDMIAGGVLFLMFFMIFICAGNIQHSKLNVIDSSAMPKLISIVMMMISVGLFVQGAKKVPENRKMQPEYSKEYLDEVTKRTWRVVRTLFLLAITIVLLRYLGFIVAGMFYLFFQITFLTMKEERNYKIISIQAVVITMAIYLLFHYGFSIVLPMGIFA